MQSMLPFRRRLPWNWPVPGLLFADDSSDMESILTVPFETTLSLSPRINHVETPEAYVYKAELPAGLSMNDIKVEIEEGNVLCLKGGKKMEKEEKTEKWHRVERSSGKFLHRFRLPENSMADLVDAVWDHGVLTVTVPKKQGSHGRGPSHSGRHVKTIQVN